MRYERNESGARDSEKLMRHVVNDVFEMLTLAAMRFIDMNLPEEELQRVPFYPQKHSQKK